MTCLLAENGITYITIATMSIMYMETGDCNCGVDRLDIVQSLA